ncbi:MAG: helix-turn-helix domain-containing protein [Paracoccaceae bacterium]
MAHDIDRLIDAACEVFGVTRAQLLSARRDHGSVYPRHLICWIARVEMHKTFAEIGLHLNRDYSTVISTVQKIDQIIAKGTKQPAGPNALINDINRIHDALKAQQDAPVSMADMDLHSFLAALRLARPSLRPALFRRAVLELGGMWCAPHAGFGDHEYSISLFGVSATGINEDELCLNWFRCALRVLEAQNTMEKAL